MENISILGAGVSGLALVESIRAKNTSCKITLIDKDTIFLPRKNTIYSPGNLSGKIDISEWSEERGVEFISGRIDKVNPKRQKIFFKGGGSRDFDDLIVASGLQSKKLPIKGDHREGFFYLSDIDPVKLRDYLKISQEACVYVSTWLGLRLAVALSALKKEVKIISSNLDFLGEKKERIISILNQKNIGVYQDAFIEEAVGESVVKAVKLSPLMIFSCQLVFVDSGFVPNLKFFDEDFIIEDRFFTNFEGVYLLGDVNRGDIEKEVFFNSNYDTAREQAGVFSEFIAGGVRPEYGGQKSLDKDAIVNVEELLLDPSSASGGIQG